jgi:hypothetical protein
LTGDAVVVDDLGAALRIGARTASLPKAMQPDHYSVLPTVPVQDPCAAAPVATELGDRLLSVTETSARPQRVASIVVVPSDEEECLTASTRDQFNAAVLADPCALVGLDFHAMTPDGCHGVRDATFAVTPVPSGAADVVPGAIAAGTSSDGTVAWSFNANAAIVEGDGLRVDIASGTGFDPELSARFLTTADRVASATTYDAQPHDSYMSATTAFRVARPDLGSTLLGGPETGADTAVWSVYRDGRRLGYAVFYYHTELADTVQFPYVFARFEQHYRQLCGVTSVLCP